ncbi:uncharacterized protein K02A2.6-like [Macrosteles quadrilineatus]|uniref:uncharacterized protein K02A2.6-like n=1 Tax=Macrosteles quadrilineatus TaxID=74068 RepID=UPI0023E1390E|nr:uncharacterized protein K02A2.6-like [Macrosteles quadrilineatus]
MEKTFWKIPFIEWQVSLDETSQDLTTFLTPFGRFKFLKLPFGISSAPEIFQQLVNKTLNGQKNAVAHMDDIIVWGKTKEEHDHALEEVLGKLQNAGFTLNKGKCQFSQKSLTFLGHQLSRDGIKIDESKVEAITKLPPPTNIAGVQRFIGMVNFVGKYIPNKSQILKPITDLLSTRNEFVWGKTQNIAFEEIKSLLASAPQLAFYDSSRPTMVSADSSQTGLGGVLFQQQVDNKWKPISYISRTLTESEKNYSNIEREALAVTWSCDKLKQYIIGKDIIIETDHKPLVSILTNKDLNDLTPRIQRLRLRLMRYSYRVTYTPGKHLATADCLSRSPLPSKESYDLEKEVEFAVSSVITNLGTTDAIIQKICDAQKSCPILRRIQQFCSSEWPDKSKLPNALKPYYPVRHEISFCEGVLLKGDRLIIPSDLRLDMLNRIHSGHFGISKCRLRASHSMWWPGISSDIEQTVNECPKCTEFRSQHHEPLMTSEIPSRPWEKACIDLFKIDGTWFLVMTDCYSRYFEIATLKTLTTSEIIEKCKSIFCRHGIPVELRSDCGTQFASQRTCLENSEFKVFAQKYNFKLTTSSPGHHQSNGSAEAAVKIAKSVLRKNKEDPYLALLSYRNTPLTANGLSPAQLLFNRRLRDNLPVLPQKLSERPDLSSFKKREEKYRESYKNQYDKHHGTRDLPQLQRGQKVWIKDLKRQGTITNLANEPRSYWVNTERNTVRRNRYHLIPYKSQTSPEQSASITPLPFSKNNDQSPKTPIDLNNERSLLKTPTSQTNNTNQSNQKAPRQVSRNTSTPTFNTRLFVNNNNPSYSQPSLQSNEEVRTRFGRIVKPVKRYEGN